MTTGCASAAARPALHPWLPSCAPPGRLLVRLGAVSPGTAFCRDVGSWEPDLQVGPGNPTCGAANLIYFVFSQSARNFARPTSVSGCFSNESITLNGIVAMSAPALAA